MATLQRSLRLLAPRLQAPAGDCRLFASGVRRHRQADAAAAAKASATHAAASSNLVPIPPPAQAESSATENPWVEVKDPHGSGKTYWWNKLTNQTTTLGASRPGHPPSLWDQARSFKDDVARDLHNRRGRRVIIISDGGGGGF
eukprot:TRINITY_DN15392_c0_g1_i1.p2 TRINITY_DN15392_c0_g1~~TRINITY_DN15392_c0_g1_i1.p2  ORF type:complete len:143 (+),score=20.56 TRINITY_DN15392_c0_g1_i1:132-560(+)